MATPPSPAAAPTSASTPATPADIINQRDKCVANVDSQLVTTLALRKPGDTSLDDTLDDLHDKKVDLMHRALEDILATADLDNALKAMKGATDNMTTVAKNMVTVTGILTNIAKYLGYATDAVNAVESVAKSKAAGS